MFGWFTKISDRALRCPVFGTQVYNSHREGQLRAYLQSCLSDEDAAEAGDEFLMARIHPSKKLLDHVSDQIQGTDAFTLLDEQLVAYEVVRGAVEESQRSNTKKVIMVKGGPGSGKSVIATNVLGDFSKKGYNVSYACGSPVSYTHLTLPTKRIV